MKKAITVLAALGMVSAANAGVDLDDLSVGTLNGGDSVMGDTSLSFDDMNGDTIGSGGSWSGGDDVYTLSWGGGDLILDLLFTDDLGDLDLFLFDNVNAGGELAQGISVDDNEQVSVAALAAGTYWVSVDGWLGSTNNYTLNVSQDIPAPAGMAVLGLGGLVAGRRRR